MHLLRRGKLFSKTYTPFKKFFPKTGENSLSGNVVREIHQDKNRNFWIGTEDGGLNKLETSTGKFNHFQPTGSRNSISYKNIHGLLINGDELWIGTFEHGLDVLNIKTGKVTNHYSMGTSENSLKSNFIYCISRLRNGEITLGTTRGAYKYNNRSNDFSQLPGMPLNNWYTDILQDNRGTIWAGTYGNGVNYHNAHTKVNGNFRYDVANPNSLSSDRVNSIFEDSDKNLWFGTEGGLCLYNRKENNFKRYTTKNGFPNNFILSILEDDQKNLWLSTSKGLVCFNLLTEKIRIYTRENGTLNDQFNFNSGYKDTEGRMYFGSVKGLISFHPKEFVSNTFVPPIYITGVQVLNKDLVIGKEGSPLKKSIVYTEQIRLPHDQSTLNISFAALSYTAPEISEYAFMMEGLDQKWTYLKRNRNAYFTNLSPGTYVFKVKALNNSGVWNEQETKLIIEILPPWWTSKWAYAFYILLAAFVAYSGFRDYHNRTEQKNRRKFELLERTKEKEVFQAKLKFFTNVAHEIRTPLTLIKAPLERVIKKTEDSPDIRKNLVIMERNTNRLIDLTNQLLDFRQTEIKGFGLNYTRANISEY
jgi:ligand-binding sensor domain-containing protein